MYQQINNLEIPLASPLWSMPRPFPVEKCAADRSCSTIIVGGGMAGLATAFELTQLGQSVVVIEGKEIGAGSTGWCGGILSTNTTVDFGEIEKHFGFQNAQEIARSMQGILVRYQKTFEGVCSWQQGSHFCLAERAMHKANLDAEVKARSEYELPVCHVGSATVTKHWGQYQHALEISGEGAVHPVELSFALAAKIKDAGGIIFEHTKMSRWWHDGRQFHVSCGDFTIRADNLVLCAGISGANSPGLKAFSRLMLPITGHVLVTQPSVDVLNLMRSTNAVALWDSLILYHYVRYLSDGRMLIGGEDLPYASSPSILSADDKHIQALYKWAQRAHSFLLPPVETAWRASMVIPFDGMPVLAKERYGTGYLLEVVTDGLPGSFLLADTIKDVLSDKETAIASIISPERRINLMAKVFAAVPLWARKPICHLAFNAFKLKDSLG